MKIHNLGSINIDFVYSLEHFVKPGETIACAGFAKFAGGKGFNQSTALARAGADVAHIGAIGADGAWLVDALAKDGADVSRISVLGDGTPTGHAIIQVDKQGQNCIIIESGANGAITEAMVDAALSNAAPGDWLLAQNETSSIAHAMRCAKARGMRVAINPAPMNAAALSLPLELADVLIVNETESAELTKCENAFDALRERYPNATIVLTLGGDGVMAAAPGGGVLTCGALPVEVVDTTAAGDCFTGYLLAEMMRETTLADALKTATTAAAICVSRHGASVSVPWRSEVERM